MSARTVSAGQLEFVWKLIKVHYPLFEQSFAGKSKIFLFRPRPGRRATVPWAVNFFTCSTHRNIKISENGLEIASMLFHNIGSQILRQFFALLSVLHAQYGTQRHTTQRLSQLFSILTGCKCDFYITSTCYLPQVSFHFCSSV